MKTICIHSLSRTAWAVGALVTSALSMAQFSQSDLDFLNNTARGSVTELTLSRLATERASSQTVRDFGKRLVIDHNKINDRLLGIASKYNLDLPRNMSTPMFNLMRRLENTSGPEFDEIYMNQMHRHHERSVAAFQRIGSTTTNGDLRSFANDSLPILRDHLRLSRQISESSGYWTGQASIDNGQTPRRPIRERKKIHKKDRPAYRRRAY